MKQRYKDWLFLLVNEGAAFFFRGEGQGGRNDPVPKLSGYFVALIMINATAKWRSSLYPQCNLSLKREYFLSVSRSNSLIYFWHDKFIESLLFNLIN